MLHDLKDTEIVLFSSRRTTKRVLKGDIVNSIYAQLSDYKVVLFGAGQNGKSYLEQLLENNVKPAYFVDNKTEQGIIEFDSGVERHAFIVNKPDILLSENKANLKIIITPNAPWNEEIIEQLKILQLFECIFTESVICCDYIARPSLGFFNEYIGFCCYSMSGFSNTMPVFPYMHTAEETIVNFFQKRNTLLYELNSLSEVDESKPCLGCIRLKKYNLVAIGQKIKHVSISCYPSICQARCIYCSVYTNPQNTYEVARHSHYPKMIAEIVQYLRNNNLISRACTFSYAPAEITVMPHKDLLIDVAADHYSRFSTNGIIFEQRIAHSLKKNGSLVSVSLDSGTRATFNLVKGLNMFEKTLDNLKMYRENGDVRIKYNILAGVNDGEHDIDGIIQILKTLGLSSLHLSFEYKMPLRSAFYPITRFVTKLKDSGLSFTFHMYYSPSQIERFIEQYYTAEHKNEYKRKYFHLREVFQKEKFVDYGAYKEYVHLYEIQDLINHYRKDTRFALLGHVSNTQNILRALNRLITNLQTPDASFEESYDIFKDSADVYIMFNKRKANEVKYYIESNGGSAKQLLDVETYFYSFEPTKLFLNHNVDSANLIG